MKHPVSLPTAVLVGLLLQGPAGRSGEAAGAQPGGHLHVRAEHDGGGPEAALLEADHPQPGALLPLRGALHGPRLLPGGPAGQSVPVPLHSRYIDYEGGGKCYCHTLNDCMWQPCRSAGISGRRETGT